MSRNPLLMHNVTVAGNQSAAATLLFVHGLGTDQTVWQQITPAFERDYRLVLLDNVGAVESNREDFRSNEFHYLNVKGYASDLLGVCTALGLDQSTVLIGHSLGALAGLLASIQRSWQFKKLVLLGFTPCYKNSEGYAGGFDKSDIDSIYTTVQSDYSGWTDFFAQASMGNPDRPQLAEAFAKTLASIPKQMMLTILYSILHADLREDLRKVPVPVCLLQAKNDYFVPESVTRFAQQTIPCCEMHVIEATGHLPHVSAPQLTQEAIHRCLQGVDRV